MIIQAVIFDFDGPLNDSFREGIRRIKVLAAIHDIRFGPEERKRLTTLWGLPGIELLEQGLGISRALAEAMYPQWERMDLHDPVDLVPGSREVLFWLRRNNFIATLLTTRNKQNIGEIFDRLDLTREFKVISTRQDAQYRKPDPRAFWFTLEELRDKFQVVKEHCVFVGDTPADIEAGKNAGIETVVVQTGPYLLKHAIEHPVKITNILNSVDDLPMWIEENHEGKIEFPYD